MPTLADTETTTRPTSSEMRAPARTLARMSRPSSSRPNQCAADGPASRSGRSCMAGSPIGSSGPISAASTAIETMAAPTLLIANPRIDDAVHEVGDQIDANVGNRDEQDAPLHERVVAKADRLNE